MKAAIYARKSTDDSDKHEDNRSVARQVERARAFCEARGWTVADDHVYADDGISGAEYQNRPGLLRLMASLKKFDVVVMSEISRLGRDMVRNAVVIDELRGASVQIWYYLTAEQEHADTPEQRIMVTLRSFAAEVERAKISQRTRDALERKALRGQNAGGRVYGYRNVWVMEDGERRVAPPGARKPEAVVCTEYEIDEQEAAVVRGIFRAYMDGRGLRTLAKALNGDPDHRDVLDRYFGGRTPPPPWKGTRSWAPTSIREMLYRERYRGKIPYGLYRKAYRGGTRTRERQETFHLVDAPELRIVPEDLWQAVHERTRGERGAYFAATAGKSTERPDTGRASKYLLSGLMRCTCCGGAMVGTSIAYGSGRTRRREPAYLCSYYNTRGSTVCDNSRRARAAETDARVINEIDSRFMTPAAVDFVVDIVLETVFAARRTAPDRLKEIEAELRQVTRELDRLITLVVDGRAPQRVAEEIAAREKKVRELELERERLRAAVPGSEDVAKIREIAHARIRELRETLHRDVAGGREVLRQILDGPISFKLDGSGYRLEGRTLVGALFGPDSSATSIRLASPVGHELHAGRPVTSIRLASPRGFEPLLPP